MVRRASWPAAFFVAGFCSYVAYLLTQKGSCKSKLSFDGFGRICYY